MRNLQHEMCDVMQYDLQCYLQHKLQRELQHKLQRICNVICNATQSNATLSNAKLRKPTLSNAKLSNARPGNAKLCNAKLSNAKLRNVKHDLYSVRRITLFGFCRANLYIPFYFECSNLFSIAYQSIPPYKVY